jgi:hypothetical protein
MRTDIPILRLDRIRRRHGSFGWIEHRFVREGFLESLRHPEALLYVFLAIVADERGISFYSQDRIRQLLGIPYAHTLESAINELVDRDLLAYRSGIYQVLDLPVSGGLHDRPHDHRKPGEHRNLAKGLVVVPKGRLL